VGPGGAVRHKAQGEIKKKGTGKAQGTQL